MSERPGYDFRGRQIEPCRHYATTPHTCPAVTVWHLGTHAVRLRCSLPAGHHGDHAAAEIEDAEEDA